MRARWSCCRACAQSWTSIRSRWATGARARQGWQGARQQGVEGALQPPLGASMPCPEGLRWRPTCADPAPMQHPISCHHRPLHRLQRDRWDAVIRGVFAGNIFDLGCAATTDMYHQVRPKQGCACPGKDSGVCWAPASTLVAVLPCACVGHTGLHECCCGCVQKSQPGRAPQHPPPCAFEPNPTQPNPAQPNSQEGISFHDTRDKLVPRPWVIDDLDALLDRLCRWVRLCPLLWLLCCAFGCHKVGWWVAKAGCASWGRETDRLGGRRGHWVVGASISVGHKEGRQL